MTDIIRIGLDTSKSLFQLHGVNAAVQQTEGRLRPNGPLGLAKGIHDRSFVPSA